MIAQIAAVVNDIPYLAPAPGISVFADEPLRRAELSNAVVRAGGRVVASGSLADALGRLDGAGPANVCIEIDARCEVPEALLDDLNGLAARGAVSALVLASFDRLDLVAARIEGAGIDILVDATAAERDAAMAELLAAPSGHVAEEGDAENRRKLAQLGEEVGRIARALAALSAERIADAGELPSTAVRAALVRSLLRLRRLRGIHFEPALFADPAWDILLDLAAARIEERSVAVSSLCIAAAVPATTALRWITQMTGQGLLVRQPDETDGRRVFIGLSEGAAGAMDGYLAAAQRIVAPAG